ncbi:hypothetical protein PA25_12170 [Pseudoalteromonas sp. A25]|uniref:non-ribosomal peptide synthetase n=1 Tax=Pseudoalteromonas sp. A25 TaxID=116092 RepID=UPI0012605AC0|nr:non-ribosomal peptide synthetase [Pseudoalteromonas sp. A25]BBN81232.1 hypothetical protein PA25_12170 [Pseudoalteromonas sp. A25]
MDIVKKVLAELYRKGIILSVVNGNLKIQAPENTLTPEIIAEIKKNKGDLIAELSEKAAESQNLSSSEKILPLNRRGQNRFPLSFAQQRLWFIDQLDGGSTQYNMPIHLFVEPTFDVDIAECAFERIIGRHEVLRTVFEEGESGPVQVIREHVPFSIERYDFSALTVAQQAQALEQLVEQDLNQVFNLQFDLLLRVKYIKLNNIDPKKAGALLFNMHHIASDGWSQNILLQEFEALYLSVAQRKASGLAPLPIQYADFAHWQRKVLTDEVMGTQLDYWKKQLGDVQMVHSIPLDYPRPELKQHKGESIRSFLPHSVFIQIQKIALDNNMTPFMLLHAAFALVISKHSNSHDIVIGSPVANRMQKELDGLIGFFVNTLVLRANTNHKSVGDYLSHVKQVHLEAQSNQDIPFEQLVDVCNVPRSTQHTPLFQILFEMDTSDQQEHSSDLGLSLMETQDAIAAFDIILSAATGSDGISFNWVYDTSIFSAEHVRAMTLHLEQLILELTSLSDCSSAELSSLSMLSAQEKLKLSGKHETKAHMLRGSDDDVVASQLSNFKKILGSTDLGLFGMLYEQAKCRPNAVAIIDQAREISYHSLVSEALGVANHLSQSGLKVNDKIAIAVDYSIESIVALLGILSAGMSYVPLDPASPDERIQYIVSDANVAAIVVTPATKERMRPVFSNYDIIDVTETAKSFELVNKSVSEDATAYIIYTSGSTGNPKGVSVAHKNVMNLVEGFLATHAFTEERVLMIPPIYFDASVGDIFPVLAAGGTLVLHPNPVELDAAGLESYSQAYGVTAIDAPAALWRRWVEGFEAISSDKETLPNLKLMMIGGESVTKVDVARFSKLTQGRVVLTNHYGPTEATVCATLFSTIDGNNFQGPDLPIGQALHGVRVYVLDLHQNLAPAGSVGELYIAGKGVTSGYINAAKLHEKHFIRDPFSDDINAKMYKTGDLVKQDRLGNLIFIGRKDHQVKIRGYRVELCDIETALLRLPNIEQALVVVWKDKSDEQRLVAYIRSENLEQEYRDIQKALALSLPEYMIPQLIVQLDEFPLTPNGKVDRKVLPEPDLSQLQKEYVEPKTETERMLCDIWQDLLGLDKVGTSDNFFLIGGHSLLATRMLAQVKVALDVDISIKEIFSLQSIFELGEFIDRQLILKKGLGKVTSVSEQESSEEASWEI